ncbi:DDE-type integrase/transposase/recombinase [Phycicoccus mangrovi]
MRQAGLVGVCHGCTRGHRPVPATHGDLVQPVFTAGGPDRVWFTDVTQHRASDGWVYCCAVIDARSRRVGSWSIPDNTRAELVVGSLEVADWQRWPAPGTILHADRGSRHASWFSTIASATPASSGRCAGPPPEWTAP